MFLLSAELLYLLSNKTPANNTIPTLNHHSKLLFLINVYLFMISTCHPDMLP